MSHSNSMQSLIRTLSSEQVDALIQEEKLRMQGYDFIYCIDADDLNKYIFPLGLTGQRPKERGLSYEYVTDEQIALYSIFNRKDFKAFVFEEHLDEIVQLINKVKFLHSKGNQVINTSKELLSQLKSSTHSNQVSDIKGQFEIIRENISLILSIAVGLQADGLEKLNQLRKSKKVVFNEDDLESFLNEEGYTDYKNSYIDDLAEIVYDFLREKEVSAKTGQYGIESELAIVKRNIAHRRDSQAIFKLIKFNYNLKKSNRKTVLLYVSSDHKTQNLFYLKDDAFEDVYLKIKNTSIYVDDFAVNYHRNTAQFFLRMLCEESTSELVIGHLSQVKEIIENKDLREKAISSNITYGGQAGALDSLLTARIDKYRKEFEDYATFVRIGEFKDLSTNLTQDNNTKFSKDEKEIIAILEEIIQKKDSNIKEWRYAVDLRIRELSQLSMVRNSIPISMDRLIQDQLSKGAIQPASPGQDYVFNASHHLPTLFCGTHDSYNPKFHDIVSHYNDSKEKLKPFILDMATRLFSATGNLDLATKRDELILKRCLLLLLLSTSKFYGEQILNYIEAFLVKYIPVESELRSHFQYILVWVLRRNQKYKQALVFSEGALKLFPDDPRFYHSLCLAKYCIFEEDKEKTVLLLKESLHYQEKALNGYKNLLEASDNSCSSIIQQNINALLNGRAFLLSLGFQYDKDKQYFDVEDLIGARSDLMELKQNDPSFSSNTTYLHTEALLCFSEYKATENATRLTESQALIELAIRQATDEKLTQMCTELKSQILEMVNTSDALSL